MNPRQRRGILLIALAVIGAVATFVSVTTYVAETRRLVGPDVTILKLSQPVPAFSPLPDGAYSVEKIPEKFRPEGALDETDISPGLVAGTDLPIDTVLQQGLLILPPQLEEGQQEIAVTVDAETGSRGRSGPGTESISTPPSRATTKPPRLRHLAHKASAGALGRSHSDRDRRGRARR